MKNPMFAQSRLVFFAAGETPMQKLEAISKENKDDISESKFRKAEQKARDFVNKMPESEAKTLAERKLAHLKREITKKIDDAKKEADEVAGGTLKNLEKTMKDSDVISEANTKVADAQGKVSSRIKSLKEVYQKPLSGDDVDKEFKVTLNKLISDLTTVEGKVKSTVPGAMTATEASLKTWSDKLITEAEKFGTGSQEYKTAYNNFNHRQEIRNDDSKLKGELKDADKYAKGIKDKELMAGTKAALDAYDKILPPAQGSDMAKWDEYKAANNAVVNTYNINKAEYMQQVAAKKEAVAHTDTIKVAIENRLKGEANFIGMRGDTPENSTPVQKAATEVKNQIDALSKIETKFGDTGGVQTKIFVAKNDVDMAYNSYKGDIVAQEIRKDGGRKTTKVYDNFKKGKYENFAKFNEAFKKALEEDTEDSSYATGEEKAKMERIKANAPKLEQIAKADLEFKEKVAKVMNDAKDLALGAFEGMKSLYAKVNKASEEEKVAAKPAPEVEKVAAKPAPEVEIPQNPVIPEKNVAKNKPKAKRAVKKQPARPTNIAEETTEDKWPDQI
jgi:hypothetical protein